MRKSQKIRGRYAFANIAYSPAYIMFLNKQYFICGWDTGGAFEKF